MTRKALSTRSVAAIRLQSWWRAVTQRRQYQKLLHQALLIQAAVRFRQARLRFLTLKQAAVLAQAIWRGKCARRFVTQSRAAIKVQAAFRGHSIRKQVATEHSAARQIQAVWRGHLQHAHYQLSKRCIVMIQASARRHLMQRHFLKVKAAARVIQCRWRAVQAGRRQRQQLQQWNKCATHIQVRWRGACQRHKYVYLKLCAVRVQAALRCQLHRRQYVRLQAATTTIQASYRAQQLGRQVRRQMALQQRSARCIQTCWRGWRQQQAHSKLQNSVVIIQAAWRSRKDRHHFLHLRHAVVTLQSAFRAVQAGRSARLHLARLSSAACTIQARWKGNRQHRRFQQQRHAAVTIQARLRSHSARTHFLQRRHACVRIQATWIALKAGQAVRLQLHVQHVAATCIQSRWHGSRQRRSYLSTVSGLVAIQAAIRRCLALRQYQRTRQSCLVIQSAWRALTAGRTARAELQLQHLAATGIQAKWRGHRQRSSYLSTVSCLVTTQAAVRCWLVQRQFQRIRHSCLVIQSAWRALTAGRAARAELQLRHSAATCIQASWRGHKQRTAFLHILAQVIRLQAAARRGNARRAYFRAQAAIVVLQSAWRAKQSRLLLKHIKVILPSMHQLHLFLCCTLRSCHITSDLLHFNIRVFSLRGKNNRSSDSLILQAAVTMQRHVRGHAVRQVLVKKVAAATRVQAQWRCHQAAAKYAVLCRATLCLQAWARGSAARQGYQRTRAAAVTVQVCQYIHPGLP